MPTDQRATPTTGKQPVDRLLTIGVFARRSRLSLKALRLYDRLGVLTPAHVDPESGYRRYRESQLASARLVAMLRRLDMPLARVAPVVSAPDPRRAELIAAYWDEVEQRVAVQRQLATHLRLRLLGKEGGYEMFEIQERDVPEQVVLTEQRHLVADELPTWIPAAIGRLIGAADSLGGMTGPVLVIYHGEVNEESDGPVEVCVPIDPTKATDDAPLRREPAHREAYTRVTKAQVGFPQILSAYDAVAHWIDGRKLNSAGAPREVYFADWDAAGPHDAVADVAFPIG
jgi:DNA-binding transcriptional MerR regulator